MARRVKQQYQSPVEISVRLIVFIFMAFLAIASPPSGAGVQPVIRIGLFPYHSPQHLIAYYDSLRKHLERNLKVTVQLETAPSVEDYTARAIRGHYDVALIPAHLGRMLQLDYRWQPLVKYVPDNTVYLVSLRRAAIKTPADLKGKTIATQDRNLLMSMAAMRWLSERGVPDEELNWVETGGLASSVYAVTIGQADASVATLSSLSLTPQTELDQLVLLWEIGNIPQLYLMGNPRLTARRRAGLQAACLSYHKQGIPVLAKVSDKELKNLDAYAAELKARLSRHVPSRPTYQQ
jgi:ABC-type phosphate/phosphonate transport system substrate-binding protein